MESGDRVDKDKRLTRIEQKKIIEVGILGG